MIPPIRICGSMTGRPRELLDERAAWCVEARAAGLTRKEIGWRLGVGVKSLTRILGRESIPMPHALRRRFYVAQSLGLRTGTAKDIWAALTDAEFAQIVTIAARNNCSLALALLAAWRTRP
jgi:hypothetical protein